MDIHLCIIKNHIIKSVLSNKSALDLFAILPIFKLKLTPCELWHEIYKDAQEVHNDILVSKLRLLMSDLQDHKYIDINELINDSKSSGSIPIPKILASSRSYKVLGKSSNILAFKSYDIALELTRQCVDHIKHINYQSLIKHVINESNKNYDIGIVSLVDHFERLSKLVTTEIINNPDDPWRIIIKFLKICDHLFALHNYHSLFAIISGLSTKNIYEFISEYNLHKFTTFYEFISFSGNYHLYRSELNKHINAIPYIGVLLGDIRHLLECKLFINNDLNTDLIDSIIISLKTINPIKYTTINETNYDIYYYFITNTIINNTEYIDVKLQTIFNKASKNKIINKLFRSNSARNSF